MATTSHNGVMVKTFMFLFKTLILIGVIGWLLSISGSVTIAFENYHLHIALGSFVLITLFLSWLVSVFFRLFNAIGQSPKTLSRLAKQRDKRLGLKSLASALSAIAGEDLRMADYYTKKTGKYLRDHQPIIAILRVMTAQLGQDHDDIYAAAKQAIKYDESALVGIRSLTETAIAKKDFRYARVLVDRALENFSHAPWAVEKDYALNTIMARYDEAHASLKKMVRAEMISKDEFQEQKASVLLAQGEMKQAYRLAPDHLPIVLAYLADLPVHKHVYKARKVIAAMWSQTPHPLLLKEWMACIPEKKGKDKNKQIEWIKSLHESNPDDASSALYCGLTLIKIGQKDEARPFIKQAVEVYPTILAYRLMHEIDPIGGWLTYLHQARRDKTWVCSVSDKHYEDWVIRPDGQYFNTLEWRYPDDAPVIKKMPRANPIGGLNQLFQANFN